jgi:acyl-CoA thioester hydrolase
MIAHVSSPFSTRVRVRYAECDMQGYVFNGHYLTWFDVAYAELLSDAAGRRYSELVAEGIDVVVAECGIRFLTPARYDDELDITVATEEPSNTSLTSRFTVARDGEPICEAWLRHVCFDLTTRRKRPWPEELRSAFPRYAAETLR